MSRARDLADSADKDIVGTITVMALLLQVMSPQTAAQSS